MTPGETRPPSREAAIEAAEEVYDRHPLGDLDEWGDLATYLEANLLHNRTVPTP